MVLYACHSPLPQTWWLRVALEEGKHHLSGFWVNLLHTNRGLVLHIKQTGGGHADCALAGAPRQEVEWSHNLATIHLASCVPGACTPRKDTCFIIFSL